MVQSVEAFEGDSQWTRTSLDSLMALLRTQWGNCLVSLPLGNQKLSINLAFIDSIEIYSLNINQYK